MLDLSHLSSANVTKPTPLFLDLMLVIQAPGKHSCGIGFIGVDVDSPRSTQVICGNVVRTTGVPPCLPANYPPTHFRFAEMGVIAHLYRGEVYRSTIWRT